MRRIAATASTLAMAALVALAPAKATSETGAVTGRVRMGVEGLTLADAGAIVVFLEPVAVEPVNPSPSPSPAQVRQVGARFDPAFLVVVRGQPVQMPNDDVIFHNVFSYSRPNEFDLGMYAAGESRIVHFEHPGLVRIYCSIHDEMDGLIFVAPTSAFARPDADGDYRISDVPAGEYRMHVWSERVPELVRPVEIRVGEAVSRDWRLGERASEID